MLEPASDPEWDSQYWDTLRDAYSARFGVPLDVGVVIEACAPFGADDDVDLDLDEDDEPVAWTVLTLMAHGETRATYATFGAAAWTGGVEVVIVAAAPFGFEGHLSRLAGAPLTPGTAMRTEFPGTRMVGVFFLPMGDGSFALEPRAATRTRRVVLQAVPITSAELTLANREPAALVKLLRNAGVTEGCDPHRPCTVRGGTTGRKWTDGHIALLAEQRAALERQVQRHARLVELDAPEVVIQGEERNLNRRLARIRYLESKELGLPRLTDDQVDSVARVRALVAQILRQVQDVVPPWLVEAAAPILITTLATHPRSAPLFEEVIGDRAISLVTDPNKVFDRMYRMLSPLAPGARAETFQMAALRGLDACTKIAQEKGDDFAPGDVWLAAATEMFALLPSDGSEQVRRAALARDAALRSIAKGWLDDDSTEPPRERLVAAGRALLLDMHLGVQGHQPIFSSPDKRGRG